MNTNKLTDSIDHLSDRYIEETLNTPARHLKKSKARSRSRIQHLPRQPIAAAAMLCIGIGIGYTVQYALPDTAPLSINTAEKPTTAPKNKNSIFSPLTVTAYAAERSDQFSEKKTLLEENVPTVLSQYSALMSNVPAMPFSFSYQKESVSEDIHFVVSADDLGILQKYQQTNTWEVTEESTSLTCKPDEKIYWQPSSNFQTASKEKQKQERKKKENGQKTETAGASEWGRIENNTEQPPSEQPDSLEDEWINSDTLGADSIITVQVYAGKTLLETQYIGISYQNSYYTATLKLSVSTDLWEGDDFTVISKGYETNDEYIHQNIRKEKSGTGGQPGTPAHDSEDE